MRFHFAEYESFLRKYGEETEAYRDLKFSFVDLDGKKLDYIGLLNHTFEQARRPEITSFSQTTPSTFHSHASKTSGLFIRKKYPFNWFSRNSLRSQCEQGFDATGIPTGYGALRERMDFHRLIISHCCFTDNHGSDYFERHSVHRGPEF